MDRGANHSSPHHYRLRLWTGLFFVGPWSSGDKPVAIMSASIGMLGGARAQYHLRQAFIFLNKYPMNTPEVIVNFAQNKFDSNGRLIDEDTRKHLKGLLENLAIWTRRLRKTIKQDVLWVM
ncbi:MAG: NAD(P)H-dependent oxidoreductase [Candidatus Nitrosopolaris sp.]